MSLSTRLDPPADSDPFPGESGSVVGSGNDGSDENTVGELDFANFGGGNTVVYDCLRELS